MRSPAEHTSTTEQPGDRELLLQRMLGGAAPDPPVPDDAEAGALAPLSYGQQRLWFLDSVDPTGREYLVPIVLRLTGSLDPGALRKALGDLAERHDVLRTRIVMVGDAAFQEPVPVAEWLLPVSDLSSLPEEERQSEAWQQVNDIADRSFDLTRGPLLRSRLLRVAEEEWWLVLTVHHIAFDAWSRGVFFRDLGEAYAARIGGTVASIRPVPYAEFARSQRRRFDGSRSAEHVEYWRGKLSGVAPLDLPGDRPRPAVRDSAGASARITLDPSLVAEVGSLAGAHSATPFMVYLAAFGLLLSQYADRRDIVIGTPSAGRDDPRFRDTVGFFLNTLPLRLDVDEAGSFADLLTLARTATVEGLSHGDVPFEYLVEAVGAERDPSRLPVCQVMLLTEEDGAAALPVLPGLAVEAMGFDRGVAKVDLSLALRTEADGGATALMQYTSALFDPWRVEQMLRGLRHLLQRVTAEPGRPLRELDLLTSCDREVMVGEWNATEADGDGVRVEELFDRQVARTPHAVAVQYEDDFLTFSELDAETDRLAAHLRQSGAGPDTVIGVHVARSLQLPLSLLAVLKAGAAYLPLEPDQPAERLAFMCQDAGAIAVLTDRELDPAFAATLGPQVRVLPCDLPPAGDPHTLPETPRRGGDLAYVLYTSGSTGRPKGVGVSHQSICNRLTWMRRYFGIDESDVILHKTPTSFDVSMWELLLPPVTGARMVVARPGGHIEPQYLANLMAEERVTTVHFVPSMLRAFLAEESYPGSLSGLRHVICSGEQLETEMAVRFAGRFAADLYNLYGPTEAAVDVTAFAYRGGQAATAVPIGRPVDNTQIYVVDRQFRPVPVGVPGELLLGGVQLARGYVGRPGLTAERFVPDPFGAAGGRLYRTGDLVRYLPSGDVEFLGRMDRQVKLRGMRIEPGEIEAVLLAQPGIEAAAVDLRGGPGGQPWLVAWVVSAEQDRDSVDRALRTALPGHMVPGAVMFVPAFPLTVSGKADLAALPDPEPAGESAADSRPPQTRVERALATIWEEILGVEGISATDNFFDLGGNSLTAVLTGMRIRQEMHRSLPVGMLLQRPTIAELAVAVGDETTLRDRGSLVPLRASGKLRPMFFVHSHGGHVFVYHQVSHYLDANRPVYALRARGLDEGEEPFDRLEDMAAFYISLIREVQPRGPYALAGWCLGGGVCYEMAQQLKRAGEEVDLLGIISLSAVQEMPDWEVEDDSALMGFALAGYLPDAKDHAGLDGHRNPPLDIDRMHSMGLDDQLEYVMEQARTHKLLRPDIDTTDEARRMFEVYRAHRKAMLDYTFEPYDGPVVLFKAERNHLPDSPEGDLGWSALAKGPLHLHQIPGNHFQLLQEPNVRRIAARLESYLKGTA
ncbi:amino acid adenylation domain-containing protein [Nonomuraea sp. NPDC050663]|uniref:amino acid adenylation domain-containing protein n=1 Tax=Nonomuraea sp. NPDC050663 TaxID=3364370 RepID=UPI0037B8625E